MAPKIRIIVSVLFAAGALCFVAALYRPSLSAEFNFDDYAHVANNQAVQPSSLSFSALARAATQSPLLNRGLVSLTFALDYLRAGLTPRAFHQTNLALHLAAAILAWLFLRALFSHPRFQLPWPRAAAALGALVFALHPIQVQSVAYIVQRMNLLSGLFVLAALLSWFRLRDAEKGRRLWLGAAFALSALAGLWSKENAIALCPLIAVLDRALFAGDFSAWLKARYRLLLFAVVAAVVISLLYARFGGSLFAGYKYRSFTPLERLLTQPRVVLWYASLWFFPAAARLSLEHFTVTSTGLFTPGTTAPAILVLVGLSVLALVRAHRAPLLALGWLWFVSGLALESSILPLEMVFEHRLYLPALGLFMIAVDLAARLRLSRREAPVLAAILLLLSLITYQRTRVWRDPISLWQDATEKAPEKSRPWANLCAVDFVAGKLVAAERWCRVSIALEPGNADAWYNLGLSLFRQSRWAEAEAALSQSAKLNPDLAETSYQLGMSRVKLARYAEAEANFDRAIQLDATDPVYWYQLGLCRLVLGKTQPGKDALEKALALAKPNDPVRSDLEYALKLLERQQQNTPP